MAAKVAKIPISSMQRDKSETDNMSIEETSLREGSTNKVASSSPSADIDIIRKIGAGAYARVYEISVDGEILALKRNLAEKRENFTSSSTIIEMDMLARSHGEPNVAELEMIAQTKQLDGLLSPIKNRKFRDDDYMLFLKYANRDLAAIIEDRKITLDTNEIRVILYQILLGLEGLHHIGIIHRDLKPANILVIDDSNTTTIRICDFSISKQKCNQESNTPRMCTKTTRAPEIWVKAPYDSKVDIWSVGCILFEMLRRKPFVTASYSNVVDNVKEIIRCHPDNIKKEDVDRLGGIKFDDDFPPCEKTWRKYFPLIDENLLSLLKGMLRFSPKSRWSVSHCLESPFFDPIRHRISSVRQIREVQSQKYQFIYNVEDNELTATLIRKLIRFVSKQDMFSNPRKADQYWWAKPRFAFLCLNLILSYTNVTSFDQDLIKKASIRFYVIAYTIIKWMSPLKRIPTWKELIPTNLQSVQNYNFADKFEKRLFFILYYQVYTPNPYDVTIKKLTIEESESLFNFMIENLNLIHGRTVAEVYELFVTSS